MDILRGHDVANDQDDFEYPGDAAIDRPLAVGYEERRMQVRAYNYWASLLGDRALPLIEDLSPDQMDDFGPYSVLLDFTAGIENPAIVYLGTALREECEIEGPIGHIADVPARSLLSRLTDHYLQIIANAAPIGFEAEFINQRGREILYRGILMPFSAQGDSIDFVFGVINWKEMASHALSVAIEREVDTNLLHNPPARSDAPIWADGPGADEDDDVLDLAGMEMPNEDAPLADWLALAREGAEKARTSEARSHAALYRAIGLAYDFALVTRRSAEEYAELLEDYGIKAQARSPMTAVIKLVFGATYDKTRITEYATALDHAATASLAVGSFAAYLASYDGGLKALVRDERAARRADMPARPDKRQTARDTMKCATALDPLAVATDNDGLAVVVARREADGTLAIVGALPEGSDLGQRVILAAAD
ncbi:PAS domain-containing protein [Sphingobium yanoikuyae]|uniref:PAS domain-containing protein n=1 Tax=Sphingobium yanoikuyae TaxID=13690 RepID=UPI00345ED079